MDWYNVAGESMSEEDWNSSGERTLQYLAASTPEHEEFNRILLVVHGLEQDVTVTLPEHDGVTSYSLLWDSSHDDLREAVSEHAPGSTLLVTGASMQLFKARQAAE
jgi:glycogen operon protein